MSVPGLGPARGGKGEAGVDGGPPGRSPGWKGEEPEGILGSIPGKQKLGEKTPVPLKGNDATLSPGCAHAWKAQSIRNTTDGSRPPPLGKGPGEA